MKKYFFICILLLLLFEVMNVYFIMPMPGSQRMNSIDAAYFIYTWRWLFRIIFIIFIAIGFFGTSWKIKWIPIALFVITYIIIYFINFTMAADHMFYQPHKVVGATITNTAIDSQQLIIGVEINHQTKAYPVRYLGYHHQVIDSVGGKKLMITYCTVCRTGRVFEPIVNGKEELFRLVGMDHFNAMFEDVTTKSWWRQATGEAITGKLKGQKLPEVFSTQTSLGVWLQLHPNSLIMQPDISYKEEYDSLIKFENGKSKGKLTGTDTSSWKNKSWIIGIENNSSSKAYDWNILKQKHLIADELGNDSVLLVLAKDNISFFAFKKPTATVSLMNDTLVIHHYHFLLNGKGIDTAFSLQPLFASQEFWHSWKTFHPNTAVYK